jgi:hypothetical protein
VVCGEGCEAAQMIEIHTGQEISYVRDCLAPAFGLAYIPKRLLVASRSDKNQPILGGAIYFWNLNKVRNIMPYLAFRSKRKTKTLPCEQPIARPLHLRIPACLESDSEGAGVTVEERAVVQPVVGGGVAVWRGGRGGGCRFSHG